MKTLGPYLLFLVVLLSAVGPARAEEVTANDSAGNILDDATLSRSVASMRLPGFERKLRARVATIDAQSAGLRPDPEDVPPPVAAPSGDTVAPASVAAVSPSGR